MDSRDRRRRLIVEVLAEGPVPSQQGLMAALRRRGVRTTQATLSRDLRDLGIVKSPRGYLSPEAASVAPGMGAVGTGTADPEVMLRRVLSAYLLSAEPAGTLVVCKTSPGGAMAVAVELDRHPPEGLVGTVGGDDTIFLATPSDEAAGSLAGYLLELAGLA
ncbi:MAG: arginine repressor [Phycisphaerales bacterium]|nr:MAG: arginine repressor [Phycisphaerales bacterium]